jgi:hypothetical protein
MFNVLKAHLLTCYLHHITTELDNSLQSCNIVVIIYKCRLFFQHLRLKLFLTFHLDHQLLLFVYY